MKRPLDSQYAERVLIEGLRRSRSSQIMKAHERGRGKIIGFRWDEGYGHLNELNMTNVGSQRLKQKSQGLRGSAPGRLYIYSGC